MEKPEFVIANVFPGVLNALVKNLMKQTGVDDPNEAVRLVNSGEYIVNRPASAWQEQDGVIHFIVVSDRKTGSEWIKYFEERNIRIGDYAKSVLRSLDFQPTSGVTYNVAVLKGTLFSDSDRTTQNIRAEADKRKLTKPNAEVACLIRDKFTDKEIEAMGLAWIINMADPINDSDGDPLLLGARRHGGVPWLRAYFVRPGCGWRRDRGFAFVVSQVSP